MTYPLSSSSATTAAGNAIPPACSCKRDRLIAGLAQSLEQALLLNVSGRHRPDCRPFQRDRGTPMAAAKPRCWHRTLATGICSAPHRCAPPRPGAVDSPRCATAPRRGTDRADPRDVPCRARCRDFHEIGAPEARPDSRFGTIGAVPRCLLAASAKSPHRPRSRGCRSPSVLAFYLGVSNLQRHPSGLGQPTTPPTRRAVRPPHPRVISLAADRAKGTGCRRGG